MKGFVANIEDRTEENADFRRVLYTGTQMQLVLMALRPGEEIGEEVHGDGDQFFRVEKGKGEVWIDGTRTKIESDVAIVVPAGAQHNHGADSSTLAIEGLQDRGQTFDRADRDRVDHKLHVRDPLGSEGAELVGELLG